MNLQKILDLLNKFSTLTPVILTFVQQILQSFNNQPQPATGAEGETSGNAFVMKAAQSPDVDEACKHLDALHACLTKLSQENVQAQAPQHQAQQAQPPQQPAKK